MLYCESDWSPAPQSIEQGDAHVVLGATQDLPNVIEVLGKQSGRLTLLVVPPYTEATAAYTALTTAGQRR